MAVRVSTITFYHYTSQIPLWDGPPYFQAYAVLLSSEPLQHLFLLQINLLIDCPNSNTLRLLSWNSFQRPRPRTAFCFVIDSRSSRVFEPNPSWSIHLLHSSRRINPEHPPYIRGRSDVKAHAMAVLIWTLRASAAAPYRPRLGDI